MPVPTTARRLPAPHQTGTLAVVLSLLTSLLVTLAPGTAHAVTTAVSPGQQFTWPGSTTVTGTLTPVASVDLPIRCFPVNIDCYSLADGRTYVYGGTGWRQHDGPSGLTVTYQGTSATGTMSDVGGTPFYGPTGTVMSWTRANTYSPYQVSLGNPTRQLRPGVPGPALPGYPDSAFQWKAPSNWRAVSGLATWIPESIGFDRNVVYVTRAGLTQDGNTPAGMEVGTVDANGQYLPGRLVAPPVLDRRNIGLGVSAYPVVRVGNLLVYGRPRDLSGTWFPGVTIVDITSCPVSAPGNSFLQCTDKVNISIPVTGSGVVAVGWDAGGGIGVKTSTGSWKLTMTGSAGDALHPWDLTPQPDPQPGSVAVMGDSYTAGEGAYVNTGDYDPGTTGDDGNWCHQAREHTWYTRAREAINSLGLTWSLGDMGTDFFACSGAKVDDMAFSADATATMWPYAGQPVATSLNGRWQYPTQAPQADSVLTANPETLLLTASGNDAGFADALKECGLHRCVVAGDVTQELADIYTYAQAQSKLEALLTSLRAAMPKTRIVLVGYPRLVDGTPVLGAAPGGWGIEADESAVLAALIDDYNARQQVAARRAGVLWVDASGSVTGHAMGSDDAYIRGATYGPRSTTVTDLVSTRALQTSGHPNQAGWRAYGDEVAARLAALAGPQGLPGNPAPDTTATYPPALPILGEGALIDLSEAVQASGYTGGRLQATADPGTFAPGSTVTVVVKSEPKPQPDQTAAADGSVSVDVTVPAGEAGQFHTIYLRGSDSYSRPVAARSLLYLPVADGDVDGDGVPDEADNCGPWPNPDQADTDADGLGDVCDTENDVPVDTTAPTVTGTADRDPDVAGWYRQPVTVSWQVSDDVDVDLPAPDPVDVVADGAGQTVTSDEVCDAAGNCATGQYGPVNLDTTAPTITASVDGTLSPTGWYTTPVTVDFTCTDDTSGVASCPAPVTLTDGSGQQASGQAVDVAGNTASVTVDQVHVDTKAPDLQVTGVAAGAVYEVGAVPVPGCQAADAGSGLATGCTVTVTGGNANGVGQFTATAAAADVAGNVSTATAVYRVVYGWDGFILPVPGNGQAANAGRVLPIRVTITDAAGAPMEPVTAPRWLTPVRGGPVQLPVDEAGFSEPVADTDLVFKKVGGAWQYGWNTDKSMSGHYWRIGVLLDDGLARYAYVALG